MKTLTSEIGQILQDESGQGIVEYAAALAFVALIIGAFMGNSSKFTNAISSAFSTITQQLNALSTS